MGVKMYVWDSDFIFLAVYPEMGFQQIFLSAYFGRGTEWCIRNIMMNSIGTVIAFINLPSRMTADIKQAIAQIIHYFQSWKV